MLADRLDDPDLYAAFVAAGENIAAHYEAREFGKAMREIMALADRANQYIDTHKPWILAKDPDQKARVQIVCTQGINLFRVLLTYLKPVIPGLAASAEEFLAAGELDWAARSAPLLSCKINPFKPLLTRIDPKSVAAMVEEVRSGAEKNSKADTTPAADSKPDAAPISIDEFLRIDLRVAKVISAENVDGADKLLRVTVSLGDETRTVLAGIRSAYSPADLEGRLVVLVANLAPRKMRFGTSEGMLLAAGPGGEEIYLLSPDSDAKPGMRIR